MPGPDPREAFLAGQLTEKTRRAYGQDLEAFFAFAGVRVPREIMGDRVTAWRNDLMDEGARPATVARKLTTLRVFCEHLVYHGLLEKNPADAKIVKTPRVAGWSRTQGMTAGQAERLLDVPDRTTTRGARDYATLKSLLHLALRREELCRIRLGDLGEERGHRTVRIAGKGGKARLLPPKPGVWQAMEQYLERVGRRLEAEPAAAAPGERRGRWQGIGRLRYGEAPLLSRRRRHEVGASTDALDRPGAGQVHQV